MCDVQGLKQRCARESRCFPTQTRCALPHSALAHPCRTSVSGQCTHTDRHTHTLCIFSSRRLLFSTRRENNSPTSLHVCSRRRARTLTLSHSSTVSSCQKTSVCLTDCLWEEVEREIERERENFSSPSCLFSLSSVYHPLWWKAQTCVGPISRRCKETPSVLRKVKVTSRLFNMMSSLCRLCMLFFLLFHLFTLRHTKLQTH